MADYTYNAPQVDFAGPLSNLGANLGVGVKRRQMQSAISALGPDATFEDRAKAIMSIDPVLGMKFLSQSAEGGGGIGEFGLNPIYGQDAQGNTVLFQPSKQGGAQQIQLPEGVQPTMPQRWLEGPNGYAPAPAKGVFGGGAMPPPTGVQTQDVSPDGTMAPHQSAIPSLGAQKQHYARSEEVATNRALALDSVDKLGELDATLSKLVDESGNANEGLQSITGNRKIGGFDTHIPNSSLYDISQTARDASATLKTSAVQIGLNTLASMRAMSAQGASGMGQLAIQESIWLQNSIRSLEAAQSPEQIAQNIKEIREHSARLRERISAKFKEEFNKPHADDKRS